MLAIVLSLAMSTIHACLDLSQSTYGIPFLLWDSTRGMGIKLVNSAISDGNNLLTSTTDRSEALEVILLSSDHIVVNSDQTTYLFVLSGNYRF